MVEESMPDYTIAMPVRNEANTLADSLLSALKQSAPPLEVLVSISGSDDGSMSIARRFEGEYKNVRVIESELGMPKALNKLIEEATTDYIIFMDGDGKADVDAARIMLQEINPDNGIYAISAAHSHTAPKGNILRRLFWYRPAEPQIQECMTGNLNLLSIRDVTRTGQEKGVKIYPDDIINYDVLLTYVLFGHYQSSKGAYVTIQPIASLRDYFSAVKRLAMTLHQIKTQYPHLYQRVDEETATFRDMDHWQEWKALESTTEKLLAPIIWGFKRIIMEGLEKVATIQAIREYYTKGAPEMWKRLTSTKQPFD